MQMIANIRKYKGMSQIPQAGGERNITKWADWNKVKLLYTDYRGDTQMITRELNPIRPDAMSTRPGGTTFANMKVVRSKTEIFFPGRNGRTDRTWR